MYDGVVGPWFLDRFLAATGAEHLEYVVLLPPAEACVERVIGRIGHGFTDEVACRHMHQQFVSARLDVRHVLDGDVDTGALLSSVLTGVDLGRFTYPSG